MPTHFRKSDCLPRMFTSQQSVRQRETGSISLRSVSVGIRSVCVLLAFLSAVVPTQAEVLVLKDMPTYHWYHGCVPTSGMMVLGYWDAYGYPNLIQGSNSWDANKANIKDAIASPGHISDYALYQLPVGTEVNGKGLAVDGYGNPLTEAEDYVLSNPLYPDLSGGGGTAHADNCLADFMGTSRSTYWNRHGYTKTEPTGFWPTSSSGLEDYATWKGYSFEATHVGQAEMLLPGQWENFVHEITLGRPVLINVSAEYKDERAGHTVAAIGFKTVDGVNYYGFRSTWDDEDKQPGWDAVTGIMWKEFKLTWMEGDWGLYSMDTLRPAGTWDATWNATTGYWSDASNWSKDILDIPHYFSAPDSSAFAAIPEGGTAIVDGSAHARFLHNIGILQLDGGSMNAAQLRNSGTIIGHGEILGSIHNFGEISACYGSLTLTGDGSSTDGTFRPLQGNLIRIQATTGSFDLYRTNTITGKRSP